MDEERGERRQESPYAGRWVARLEGRIVAHGGTPEQAREAAQRTRYKEKAEITFMPPASSFSLSPLVDRVCEALPDQEIYLVGGAVRDALLGHVSHDLDFAVPKDAIAVARKAADRLGADFYILDQGFDAARVIVQGGEASAGEAEPPGKTVRDMLDFTSFRRSMDWSGTAAPSRAGAGLDADLQGRDFTINAIAYEPRGRTILDPLNGAADLRAKIIRMCSGHAMEDDAIRILRGVRLAAALDFKIDPATREAMKAAAAKLPGISAERKRDELFKTLAGPRPDASLRALELLGVFPFLMPELAAMKGVEQSAPHVADVWNHTLSVMQHLEGILGVLAPAHVAEKNNDLFTGLLSLRLGRYREQFAEHFAKALNPDRSMLALLFFAALYHDVSKPTTKSVEETGRIRFLGHEEAGAAVVAERAKAFNLSNDEVQRLQMIAANHMRFHQHARRMEAEEHAPSRKSIYRFFRDTGEAGVDLILLGLADLRGVHGPTLTQETWTAALDTARIFLESYWERPEETVRPPRLIGGDDLMKEFGLKPGPIVGEVLEAIREGQATGEIAGREEALQFAREWLKVRNGE